MIDRSLGPYRLDRELGSGGMGKVYAATLERPAAGLDAGTTVALKVVHPHLLETEGFFKRFLREAEIGRSVRHDNVVRTVDCDQLVSGGQAHAFLVMEYVEGQTLADLMRDLDRVPEELCRHVARAICKGLAAIHAAGAVHRDLKPENVLITADHVVKVMDLGVAQLAQDAFRLSQSGAFVGSVQYASPEQFGRGEVDTRSDLHALGLILYELSTGQHPYRGDDFRAVMKHVLEVEPRRVGEVNPQLSPFFEEVVHTLLAKRREDRFASAVELLEILEEGEESEWWHLRAIALRAQNKRPLRRIRIPRETAVYGRENELARLRALFERAAAGDGQVVLIEGEAGIGKSRLVDEMVRLLQEEGADLNFLFGSYPPGGAATASGAFSTAYREHFGEPGCAPYLSRNPVLIPAFDALLRGESAPTGVEHLTKDSLQTCFVAVTHALATERVTIVLIDDLHFSPAEGRALFTAVASSVQGHRVLLVGTARPGVASDWQAELTRLDQTSHLPVHRLGPKDLAKLLQDSLKSEQLAHALGVQVGLKSDGNPFFAFEIIRGLREGQFITQRPDGTWVSTQRIDEIQIPSSVLDLVNARVADLAQEDRDLLDVASCCGFEFAPDIVAQVVGEPLLPTLKRFAAIEKKHRLVRAAGRKLVFDHHQVQETLYGSLYVQMREAYHGAIADALSARSNAVSTDPAALDGALAVELCEHYFKAARPQDALRFMDRARAHLEAGHQHEQSLLLAERALASPGLLEGRARAVLLESLGEEAGPLQHVRGVQEQVAALEEALHLADASEAPDLRARLLSTLGWRLQATKRRGECEALLREALELCRACGDRSTEAFTHGNLGHVAAHAGRFEEALALHQEQLRIGREAGDARAEGNAHNNCGIIMAHLGRFEEALAASRRAEEVHRAAGHRFGEAGGMGNVAHWLNLCGHPAEALAAARRHVDLTREIGYRNGELMGTCTQGEALARLGRWSEAKTAFERALAIGKELSGATLDSYVLRELASAEDESGDLERALRLSERALEVCRDQGMTRSEPWNLLRHAQMLERAGDVAAARDHYATARDRARLGPDPDTEVFARCRLALLPGGDPHDALAAVEQHAHHVPPCDRPELHFLLFRATGDRSHLDAARQLLDATLADLSTEDRASALGNVRVNREIVSAWRELSGG